MRHLIMPLLLSALIAPTAPAHQINPTDTVELHYGASADGRKGVHFAWRALTSREAPAAIADGYEFVKSDFGSWDNVGKKMYDPTLTHNPDGSWTLTFYPLPDGSVMAMAQSPDLLSWKPQEYAMAVGVAPERTDAMKTIRVPYSTVQSLEAHAGFKKWQAARYDERAADDPVRFANLKPLWATLSLNREEAYPISTDLIGIFFEDINQSADGGLYAELVMNRDFEWSRKPGFTAGWTVDNATLEIADVDPIHPNNPHYAVVTAEGDDAALTNSGFDGIALVKGEKYDFSARVRGGSSLKVMLIDRQGRSLCEKTLKARAKKWGEVKATLIPDADCPDAQLRILPAKGTLELDMVSLFPRNTFKGRKNGLRSDLAQALADLHPRFVRFPGGCVAHGQGIDNIYDWKGSVGALEERTPLPNLWGYHQTRGLGYHEYLQFCEDIGAEPLPVLAAGVPCQNSNVASRYTVDNVTLYGQQGGIPMGEAMDSYIQDVLDLVEYCNGDAKTTVWGRKRAQNGHPAPFNLKYLGIGNEDLISVAFEERFKLINDAVTARYPDITVVGTVGPFYEGGDYDEGWRFALQEQVPMVDEHYYVSPGWMIYNQDYYDNYQRGVTKVYLGEYAAHLPGRPSNIETALAEALWLANVERNGDVVSMTSYAPLLCKDGHRQWSPDLIYFSNTEVRPTVDYYVQCLYGQNPGQAYIPSKLQFEGGTPASSVRARVAVSVVDDNGEPVVKAVNMLPVEVTLNIADLALDQATATVLSGDPSDSVAVPVTSIHQGAELTLPAYSFVVLR